MLHEGLTCAINGCHMGMTAEEIVEALQRLARRPGRVRRREPARGPSGPSSSGVFDREIVAGRRAAEKGRAARASRATSIRAPGTTVEKLAALEAGVHEGRHVTAGNASGINDGAAALVVATETKARELGRKPLATNPGVLHDRRRPDDHGDGAGRGDAQGARSAPG